MDRADSSLEQRVVPAEHFVRLGLEHLKAVAAIERQSFANPWSAGELGWLVQEESGLCLGLWVEGELVGYCLGQTEGALFHLASLAVATAWRRQGWGSRLLLEILNRARRRGCGGCRLEVRASNLTALKLYHCWGFGEEGRLARFYTRPVEDGLIMYREL
ncbi:MAG: ribosomal protein S18-alanine N-acetyltransferase [Candidatus Handelsmanbacteria bacterium]|nr:ribosomal protein S18-alanine N-acetyltransferase [Candidatus Handelsmanbacteria bacterium]